MSASVESRYHIGLQIVSVWVFAVRQDLTKKIYIQCNFLVGTKAFMVMLAKEN